MDWLTDRSIDCFVDWGSQGTHRLHYAELFRQRLLLALNLLVWQPFLPVLAGWTVPCAVVWTRVVSWRCESLLVRVFSIYRLATLYFVLAGKTTLKTVITYFLTITLRNRYNIIIYMGQILCQNHEAATYNQIVIDKPLTNWEIGDLWGWDPTNYNHGQKSWRTFAFLGRFPIYTGPTPPLTPQTMLDACIHKFFRFSTLYRVEGGRTEREFRKGCIVLWGNPEWQKNMNIALLSQGLLCTIVVSVRTNIMHICCWN